MTVSDHKPPPVPDRRPHSLVTHGDERIDEWYWLREKDNPEVIAHLEAENAYTDAALAHLAPLRNQLFQEIKGRVMQTDASAPYRDGDWWYYARQVEGRQYPIRCRKRYDPAGPQSPGSPDEISGDEVVVLDENIEAGDREFFSVATTGVSPDGRLYAWAVDTEGNEHYTVQFRELTTGEDLADQIPGTYYGLAWANDNRTVFYVTLDGAERPHRVWRHQLGTSPAEDVLVYEESDERFHVGLARLRSGAFLSVTSHSKITTEVRLISTDDPTGDPVVVTPRRAGVEYTVDHGDDTLWIVTNDGAADFRLVAAPVADPSPDNWQEVLPERLATRLMDVEVFASHLVIHERHEGVRRIQIMDLHSGELHAIEQAESVSTAMRGINPEFDSPLYRFTYTSMITPNSTFDYDVETRERTLVKRQPVLGGYEPADYRTERRWAVASDGTRVPLTLAWKAGTRFDGSAPCLLYGYGSYESTVDPSFNTLRLPWLDRGGIYAVAHVRGGGEMGRAWYESGKLEHKTNTFTDFVACAEALIEQEVTSPERLVARGGSAGGLLMGAVANLRPDLFRAMVAQVPFVDCLTTILDEDLPLSVIEWDEWGNPNDPKIYEVMKGYSPYDNVTAQDYPRMLVTAGLNDPRVSYWEPAKWVAKLRTLKTDENQVLLKTQMGAGHGGPSGRYSYWEEEAFNLAFMLDAVKGT
ncbi:MAG TPA: S9 family peptidase [Acidimicrobiales bacterium]|nr:S9 family peptidase [Acidimicrobiales bacterium]